MRSTVVIATVMGLGALALSACNPAAQTPGEAHETAVQDTATGSTPDAPVGAVATARFSGAGGQPAGVAQFTQGPTGVVIRIEAQGLTPGWHGLHLHAVGTCDGPGFQSAGDHVHTGPEAEPVHGLLNADRRDSGDLPNIYAGADGRAFAEVFTPFVRLADSGPGEHLLDADGSALLIHANPDDHLSQPIGGSGDRVICGVIAAG